MAEWLLVLSFAALVIKGVHAVTRKGRLLNFLSIEYYHNAEKEYDALVARAQSEKMTSWLNLGAEVFPLVEDVVNGKVKHFSYPVDQMKKLIDDHKMRVQQINNKHTQAIIEIDRKFSTPRWYRKALTTLFYPVTECELCMSSFWGLLILGLHLFDILMFEWHGVPVVMVPLSLFALAGAMSIVGKAKDLETEN